MQRDRVGVGDVMVRHGDEDSDDFVDCMDLARFDSVNGCGRWRRTGDIATSLLEACHQSGTRDIVSATQRPKRARFVNVRSCMKHDHQLVV